ncbi:MAG: hypothetical protein ACOC32_03210 [Nanoarchaeota archaeon]
MLPADSEYAFVERFASSNLTSDWNVSGNYSLSGSYTSLNSTLRLINTTLSQDTELSIRFRTDADSQLVLALSETLNISEESLSIEPRPGNRTVEVCWNDDGSSDCSRHNAELDGWHELRIETEDNLADIYLDGMLLNTYPQYYTVSSAHLIMNMSVGVEVDDITYLERVSESFSVQKEERLVEQFTGTAFGGEYVFEMPLEGYGSGDFSVVTTAKKSGMNSQYSADSFSTRYNRVRFDTDEEGVVNEYGGRYIVNTEGVLKVRNPNDSPITIDLSLDTPLIIAHISGDKLTSDQLNVNVGPFGTATINYIATGILSKDPLADDLGVLATTLSDNLDQRYHEMGMSIFDKEQLELPPSQDSEEGREDQQRKELRYTVEGDFILDRYSQLIITKYVSDWRLQQGDVIDVILKVANGDPFSRSVNLHDRIPDEFELVHYPSSASLDATELSWDFKMNKESAKVFSYKLRYIGNSSGEKRIGRANATSDRLLVYSNEVPLVRMQQEQKEVFVTKTLEYWNDTDLYASDDAVRVTISVFNMGELPVHELFIDDMPHGGGLFVNPSISTVYKGRWVISKLKPGEIWSVTYLTDIHDGLRTLPSVDSYVDTVAMDGDVVVRDAAKAPVWRNSFFKAPLLFFVVFIFIIDLLVFSLYVYRNPYFDVEGEYTPAVFLNKVAEHILDRTKTLVAYPQKMLASLKKNWTKTAAWIKKTLSSVSEKGKNYYKSRNISLVAEQSQSAFAGLKKEFNELKSLSLKDWLFLFRHYKKKFFTSLHNRFTYGLFLLSGTMLKNNPDSKFGHIFGYAAKVLNPELKSYVGQLMDKKLQRKQEAYEKEIGRIDELRKMNRSVSEGKGAGIFGKIRRVLRSFFKR